MDAWEERFYGNTNSVISEIKGGKTIRVEVYCETRKDAEEIQKLFGGSVRELKSKNWASMGPMNTTPIIIRDRLVISPLEDREALIKEYLGREIIVVPAEMAFGTGDHPTTSTCLRLLVDHAKELEKGWSFLDLGTGSGVLAIAGKLFGAGEVKAFDYDPKAVEVAQLNASRNVVDDIEIFEADVFTWKNRKKFEVVAANLFSTVLIEALPLIRKWIKPGGRLILSGILFEQSEAVFATAEGCGFKPLGHKKIGKWVTASFDAPA
ncbi:50S ribosomal protein L11 methyltransferase [Akkermansiaceae bacterium]|nr:50S ribosomal protein L11 methyltransferase [Akkermansiaceae bacterium]MDB4310849.1 50S ribosomal protein L11 methyltransferase [bacterium]MDB4258027.1 50S ribosomal protein L11 methyltransferase [Akkermansiaceae bacterium]MDB4261854.1 50S ribosomal protein L11 methyltransferase [Akkermansiaceae bacterium]MDB4282549.1 50S ribosomal protein L11 methyltransferase [Akkermansiaceae bacterium]